MVQPIDVRVRILGIDEVIAGINKMISFTSKGATEIDDFIKGIDNEMKELTETINRKVIAGLLGIMFFGIQLKRMFGGLAKELHKFSTEMAFSVIQTSLMVAMFQSPIFQAFRKGMFELTKTFLNLPEPIKQIIGSIQLFLGGLGSLIANFASLGLAAIGFKTLFGKSVIDVLGAGTKAVARFISSAIGALVPLLPTIAAIGAAILALIVIFKLVFDQEFRDTIYRAGRRFGAWVYELGQKWGAMVFKAGQDFGGWISNLWNSIHDFIFNAGVSFGNWLSNVWSGVRDTFSKVKEWIINKLRSAWNYIKDLFSTPIKLAFDFLGLSKIRGFQLGGTVKRSGLAMVHKGEVVVPKHKASNTFNSFSPNITINANIASDMDIDYLARRINDSFATDFRSRVI